VPLNKSIDFVDSVKGPQHFNSDDIGDFIIRRADGTSSFMFCNAIDDSLMNITNVLRGEDHLANTPRQLMILDSLSLKTPNYGHLSLITGDDGAKLSKREDSFSLRDLHEEGYLPKAVLNYLSRLSHAYDDQRLLSFDELASLFHLEKLSRSSARFDRNQLLHWQKEAVMALDHQAVLQWLGKEIVDQVPSELQDLFVNTVRPNICFPKEATDWMAILFGETLHFNEEQKAILKDVGESFFVTLLSSLQKNGLDLKIILDEVKTSLGVSGKRLFMPVRIALTGQQHGPELVQIVAILGEKKVKSRFEEALHVLSAASQTNTGVRE
jgi:glutamyl-tRNA synthetase